MNTWVMAGNLIFSSGRLYTGMYNGIGKTALLQEEFAKRNVKVLAVSVDSLVNMKAG